MSRVDPDKADFSSMYFEALPYLQKQVNQRKAHGHHHCLPGRDSKLPIRAAVNAKLC